MAEVPSRHNHTPSVTEAGLGVDYVCPIVGSAALKRNESRGSAVPLRSD